MEIRNYVYQNEIISALTIRIEPLLPLRAQGI